jgi:hypothetical protein
VKGKCQVVVDFLETQFVAERIFVQVAAGVVEAVLRTVVGFPVPRCVPDVGSYERGAACMGSAVVDLVIRYVGKQRGFRRDASGRQSACRGHEQPVIVTGHDANQKRRHFVDISNGVKALAIDSHKFTGNLVFRSGVLRQS